MIKEIKQVGRRCKKKVKQIAIGLGIAGIAITAGIVLQPEKIPFVMVNGEKIEFVYTDENSGENLIIRTDKQTYSNGDYIYFAVQNKKIAQTAQMAGFFKGNESISDIEVLIKNVPYQVNIPEYITASYDCSYKKHSSTTKEVITIAKTCEKQELIGSHSEIRYEDRWISQTITDYDSVAVSKFVSDNKIPIKDKKNYKAKEKVEVLLPQDFTYFRGTINCPMMMKGQGDFFLEVVGSKKGYGHLK